MKAFTATKRDNDRGVLRLELTGEDVELIEATVERLAVLLKIEAVMGSVAMEGPFITSNDVPHATEEGMKLLIEIAQGWGTWLPGDVFEVVEDA